MPGCDPAMGPCDPAMAGQMPRPGENEERKHFPTPEEIATIPPEHLKGWQMNYDEHNPQLSDGVREMDWDEFYAILSRDPEKLRNAGFEENQIQPMLSGDEEMMKQEGVDGLAAAFATDVFRKSSGEGMPPGGGEGGGPRDPHHDPSLYAEAHVFYQGAIDCHMKMISGIMADADVRKAMETTGMPDGAQKCVEELMGRRRCGAWEGNGSVGVVDGYCYTRASVGMVGRWKRTLHDGLFPIRDDC